MIRVFKIFAIESQGLGCRRYKTTAGKDDLVRNSVFNIGADQGQPVADLRNAAIFVNKMIFAVAQHALVGVFKRKIGVIFTVMAAIENFKT